VFHVEGSPTHKPLMLNGVRAAQYLRTSRDEQQGSIELQQAAIQNYAERQGLQIVKTYVDRGRSGLTLKQRPGMKHLLRDVVSGGGEFSAILVYSVSRWGRFQDTDEAAHYEFICKRSGVQVHYCAETFTCDCTPFAAISKSLKRAMAGEYSRELSVKCFAGQKNLVERGYHVGGKPGYGLRRMLISADGMRRSVLRPGEYKPISTDRIVLVPGPKHEVDCVREIYAMAVRRRMSPFQIAKALNERGDPYQDGKDWRTYTIERILKNAKYAGCNVWNKTSRRLHASCTSNPPEQWIIKLRAYVPIIDQNTFDQAQSLLRKNQRRWSDEQLLESLNVLLAKHGKISEKLIARDPATLSVGTYYRHFGGFRRLYQLIGYEGQKGAFLKSEQRKQTLLVRDDLVKRLKNVFPGKLTFFNNPQDMRTVIRLDSGVRIAVRICRRKKTLSKARWRLYWGRKPVDQEDAFLICLLNRTSTACARYYLIRGLILPGHECSLSVNDTLFAAGFRLNSLAQFYDAANCFLRDQNRAIAQPVAS
jgi:DNA invertase Pin-like site-specific DNA recombinase